MTRRGKKKPAREMKTAEAAERLFGKRVVRRVQSEVKDSGPNEKRKAPKSRKKSPTETEHE